MKKRFKRMLAMMLVAAMLLSGGVPALAAEETEAVTETDVEVGGPLPTVDGFDVRNVYVSQTPGTTSYTINILEAKNTSSAGKPLVFGIAKYDKDTGKAEAMPEQKWMSPDGMKRVTFKDVSGVYFILTSVDSDSSRTMTPADRFNKDNIGLKFVLPTMNVYDAMQPEDPSKVTKRSDSVVIRNTDPDRAYNLFDSRAGRLVTDWVIGTGEDVTIPFEKTLYDVVVAVTHVWKSKEPYIKPDTPHVEPGGDVALTKVGFSLQTAMCVLTIQATPGLEYAIAQANGEILDISQREWWGITAETEEGFNVMADSTNFYAAPAQGNEILFRVPPGGQYYVITRFPDGTTSKPEAPYQAISVQGNVIMHGPFFDPEKKEDFMRVVVRPASQYSRYAAKNKNTGEMTRYYWSPKGEVLFDAYMPEASIEVVALPISLSGSGEGTPSPGQGSPTRETMPPVLNKSLSGRGETQDGQNLTVGPWDANNSTFASGNAAVENALGSGVGQLLDPQSFSGAALVSVAVDPFTMLLLYGWDGKPSSALYYYNDQWFSTPLVDLEDGTYMVNLKEGIVGYIDLTDLAG